MVARVGVLECVFACSRMEEEGGGIVDGVGISSVSFGRIGSAEQCANTATDVRA